jgi:nitrogen regulatory protein P-II 2
MVLMTTTSRTLITLVAESGLENRLLAMVREQGARGYTVSTAHGEGPRGDRASDISGGNIRLETVVTAEVAQGILAKLESDYFPHYSLTCWISDVQVIRDDRY